MVITTPPVMRMLRKTQPRISVKSLYFGRLLCSVSRCASIGLTSKPHRGNAELLGLDHAQGLPFCALPHIVTKEGVERRTMKAVAGSTSTRLPERVIVQRQMERSPLYRWRRPIDRVAMSGGTSDPTEAPQLSATSIQMRSAAASALNETAVWCGVNP